MNIDDKLTQTDGHAEMAMDAMQRLDSMTDTEIDALVADVDAAGCCSMLLGYREARMTQASPKPDVERAWEQFHKNNIQPARERRRNQMVRLYSVSVAAAIILAFVFLYFGNNRFPDSDKHILAFTANGEPQQIMMGAGGSEPVPISRQSGEDGVVVNGSVADFSRVTASSQSMRTICTPRGRDFKVVLSDGTVVLLNADSRLIFPTHFNGKERDVKLVGEAYFKVSHDAAHPFIVRAGDVCTRVLGTEFDLKAYPGSDTHVTLIKGSVIVGSNAKGKIVKLIPGQDAALKSNNDFDVTTVDTEYYVQWKEGYFYFDNMPLIDVVRELGRWYNVDVEICDNSLMSYRLHFIAERRSNISEVIENLNEFSYLSVVQQGQKIVISKKK